jgi:UDP-N-acetyl-D-glucosamine/UDP-N-acetyl-D-galactosamine dehydrogenase
MLERKISVIGLGYVGLPVAVAFGKLHPTIGFDINPARIKELKNGNDATLEVATDDLMKANITFTDKIEDLTKADFHIIAVPTPVDNANKPDLTPVLKASETVGKALKKGDIIVYESTVYPGATEEDCVPVLERVSGLKCGFDFKVGYSPERINPGDKEHTFTTIVKVVSGQDQECLDIVAEAYSTVVEAGVYRAATIKVAEAAKVIENTQRDLNIALMNELSLIFHQMGIDTNDVLEAAGTKWNFLKFFPGLVGGHCIGVDPYYLTHKAEIEGYIPQVILAGRRINDGMSKFIVQNTIKKMIHAGHQILGSTVTVLGLTFKDNCPDIRNSKVIDIINELKEFGVNVQISDPMVNPEDAKREYGVDLIPHIELKPASALLVAVAHDSFKSMSTDALKRLMEENGVLIDVKCLFEREKLELNKITYWRL